MPRRAEETRRQARPAGEPARGPEPGRLVTIGSPGFHRALLDSMTEGVSLATEDGRIVYTNPAEDRMFGYAPGELLGRHVTVQNAYDADDNRRIVAGVIEQLKARGSWQGRWHNRRKDGTEFTTEARITAVEVDGTRHWLCVQRDVSEAERAEAARRESEEQLRLLADALPMLVSYVDAEERHRLVNAAYERAFGRTREAMIGRTIRELLGDEAYALRRPRIEAALRGEPQHFEACTVLPDGSLLDTELVYQPRLGADGAVAGFFILATDVTGRNRSAQILREESRTLETLNETGAALAGELDLERVVQMVTDAGVALTGAQFGAFFYNVLSEAGESYMLYTLSGVDRSAFEGLPMPRNTTFFGPTFRGEGVVRSDDVLADPRYGHSPPWLGLPEGHLPVRSFLAVPVASRSGAVIGALLFGHPEPGRFGARHERLMVGIAAQAAIAIDNARLYRAAQREIDERRRAEARLQDLNDTLEQRVADEVAERAKAEEALRQAQKMEAVGQLTGGIAHDFNNLLQAVQGALDLIRRKPEDAGRVRRWADNAIKATERGARLTAQLLAFSRLQRLETKPVILADLIGGMRDMLARTLGPMIRLRFELDEGGLAVMSDPTQLEMAVLNLAINARDAMPGGGELRIATRRQWIGGDPELAAGEYVLLMVRDTGTGMSPDVAARAFDPFFTTKGVGKGTGLGLSQVYGVARHAGGTARIDSAPGHGTTVTLLLRGAEADAAATARPDATVSHAAVPGGTTVLVVDDDPDVRRSLVDSLETLGYGVLEAADARAGLALLEQQAPDLLLVDFAMPEMNGAEMTRAARALRPGLPVVFASGYADTGAIEAAGESATTILRKPFRIEELQTLLAEALRRG